MKLEHIVAVPPDGGWGWVIVVVCFYALALIDVPSIGFQVILQDLMDSLEIAASTAAIIFSSYTLMLYFMGPLAGGICNRFGFRATAICGCLLMMFGFFVSFYVSDFISFIIFFGLISGFGSSLVFMVGNVAPGFWFEYKRAIALGLASAATGFAVFSVSVTGYVKEAFACAAVLCGLALLLKMPPMVELESSKPVLTLYKKNVTALDIIRARIKAMRPIRNKVSNEQELSEEKMKRVASAYGVPMKRPLAAPSRYLQEEEEPIGSGCARWLRWCLCQGTHEIGARPLYRKDIFYQGNVSYAADIEEMPKDTYGFSVSKLPTVADVKQEVECHCKVPEAVVRAINEMVDFSLFKSTVFQFL
ncbi:uncharacterized protein, partial [Halyomorpha halys]|uniref:uncharacterized protein n=1 Tax=Halyomorpha halys TaxID=286706 RepID=UPI0006D4FAFA